MNSQKNVLLIDDDVIDQEFFISAFSFIENLTLIKVAKNGNEALKALDNCDILPSIIFLDVEMPLMGGIECLEKIMLNPKIRNIPIFMLSSRADQQAKAVKIGARGFIAKPDDEPTLILKIRQAIAQVG